ncbi:MAG: acetyl-CoA carboxylase carboxyltransferase subunit alpha [Nitrospirota bacterium]
MTLYYLSFEQPLADIEKRIEDLKRLTNGKKGEYTLELERLRESADRLKREIYSNLTPWQKTQIARHPYRPYTLDYINLIAEDFIEVHGDRGFSDDPSIVTGYGWFEKTSVMFIGHQKGRGTRERIYRNFGQPHPEGYRKALRIMKLASKFKKPIITLIDTPGAYPGIGAEERGQGEAIARNLFEMSMLKVPIVVCIIGEGGSGGALALGVGDRILMLEHAIYSVISPEGCAAILWKKENGFTPDTSEINKAAESLKITAQDLLQLGIIDEIVDEPLGGAHRDMQTSAKNLAQAIKRNLKELLTLSPDELVNKRYERLKKIGAFEAEI